MCVLSTAPPPPPPAHPVVVMKQETSAGPGGENPRGEVERKASLRLRFKFQPGQVWWLPSSLQFLGLSPGC